MKKLITVFIGHSNKIVEDIRMKYPTTMVFFVGNADIDMRFRNDKQVVIARDLPHNIEDKTKLLTFTVWYAISKNRLFQEYDYITLLEYDVVLQENFEPNLLEIIEKKPEIDVFSFFYIKRFFFWDINPTLFYPFIEKKGRWYNICQWWYNTTNHCMKRSVLDAFVDWYYPDCLHFWYLDRKMVSWYHERLFSVFIEFTNKKVYLCSDWIQHVQIASHLNTINHKKESVLPTELWDAFLTNPTDLEIQSKIDVFYSLDT
jgi:GR25 family glycosyltransferase involved in LPS biosynthesis